MKTMKTLLGEIHGQTQVRVGPNFLPSDRPHYLTDTNPLCASLPIDGSFDQLVIECITPITGLYVSITDFGKDLSKLKLCDVIVN